MARFKSHLVTKNSQVLPWTEKNIYYVLQRIKVSKRFKKNKRQFCPLHQPTLQAVSQDCLCFLQVEKEAGFGNEQQVLLLFWGGVASIFSYIINLIFFHLCPGITLCSLITNLKSIFTANQRIKSRVEVGFQSMSSMFYNAPTKHVTE